MIQFFLECRKELKNFLKGVKKKQYYERLRRWLVVVNFYRRFIKNAGKNLAPLERVLSPKKVAERQFLAIVRWSAHLIPLRKFEPKFRHLLCPLKGLKLLYLLTLQMSG